MKKLWPNKYAATQMLEVTEATAESREGIGARMAPLRDGEVAPWLAAGKGGGRCTVAEVRLDGTAVAAFWWWFSVPNKTLVVNAAGSLVNGDVLRTVLQGAEKLGREIGATSIQFETPRRGLVEKTKACGYLPTGVVLRKNL